ncbi:hypothetical protein E2C01_069886 [Portunus trituberculatus]|uniref:Uncharacterized protein n=1 Tax=Portunus trituberculatus TaxID=210409 RepID=A0A5B7I0L3_PORTR|nr:hypothetical protein [Portunus trituberculatus]
MKITGGNRYRSELHIIQSKCPERSLARAATLEPWDDPPPAQRSLDQLLPKHSHLILDVGGKGTRGNVIALFFFMVELVWSLG